MRRILSKQISIPIGAVLAGGIIYASIGLADYTPGAYLDAQTFLVIPRMRRQSAGSVSCSGVCRTAQAAGANPLTCVVYEADQISFAACLTQLNTDCTPQNVVNCTSGERL